MVLKKKNDLRMFNFIDAISLHLNLGKRYLDFNPIA